MANLSPKIVVINHLNSLINQVDIEIEECIGKYKEDQFLGELNCFPIQYRNPLR